MKTEQFHTARKITPQCLHARLLIDLCFIRCQQMFLTQRDLMVMTDKHNCCKRSVVQMDLDTWNESKKEDDILTSLFVKWLILYIRPFSRSRIPNPELTQMYMSPCLMYTIFRCHGVCHSWRREGLCKQKQNWDHQFTWDHKKRSSDLSNLINACIYRRSLMMSRPLTNVLIVRNTVQESLGKPH